MSGGAARCEAGLPGKITFFGANGQAARPREGFSAAVTGLRKAMKINNLRRGKI